MGPSGDAPAALADDLANLEINNESYFHETPTTFNYDEFTAFNLLIYKVKLFRVTITLKATNFVVIYKMHELLNLIAFWRRFKQRDGTDGADRIGTCNLANDRTW